jgi:putative secretion ATPase (PEP-CTERM system associated)
MYEAFYGFSERPFQLNPDPQFYFDSKQHRRATAFVQYGLHQSEGFIIITGEVGAGKTTLVRNLLDNLDASKVVAANLVSTQLDAEDMLRMVAAAFGIRTRDASKADLLLSLEALLTSQAQLGKRCLLIVDEAQNLTPRAVEELRMLSNFQLGTHALLQSFLVGQPEFRLILQSPHMHQLRQRVIAACHIGPLEGDDTRRYIEHRLTRVGWKDDNPQITPEAFEAIYEASGGVPRRINLLCDRLLLSGFLSEKRSFSAHDVHEVAGEISNETMAPGGKLRLSDPLGHGGDPAGRSSAAPDRAGETAFMRTLQAPEASDAQRQLEQEIRDVKDTLARVERGNQATLGLFRKFLDWMRSHEVERP